MARLVKRPKIYKADWGRALAKLKSKNLYAAIKREHQIALNRTQQQLIARAFDNAICDAVFEQEKAEKKIDSQKFLNALEVFRDKLAELRCAPVGSSEREPYMRFLLMPLESGIGVLSLKDVTALKKSGELSDGPEHASTRQSDYDRWSAYVVFGKRPGKIETDLSKLINRERKRLHKKPGRPSRDRCNFFADLAIVYETTGRTPTACYKPNSNSIDSPFIAFIETLLGMCPDPIGVVLKAGLRHELREYLRAHRRNPMMGRTSKERHRIALQDQLRSRLELDLGLDIPSAKVAEAVKLRLKMMLPDG